MKLVTTKFKSGGLHEKHVVATWNVENHLIYSKERIYFMVSNIGYVPEIQAYTGVLINP